ncbi:porin family protein [Luteibacter pinisoli]|uniref:Porin family protein n=1 Tax=Luteibacter pinisoli TaxID=2589080 RepID=A0A4Y5Z7M1_9GAMM|nr:outer membrane beta-barrel protein [Luteibacter pinisoli]QDE41207.1 porin family protein [Luteibacter pinisoli]
MRNAMLAAATAVLLLPASFTASASSSSASVTQTGAFVAVSGGTSHNDIDRNVSSASHFLTKDDSSTAFSVVGGYRWVVSRPFSLGIEGGYVSLGKTDWSQISGGLSTRFRDREKTKSDAVLVGVNGKVDLPHGFTATARLGLAHVRTRYQAGSDAYVVYKPTPPMSLQRSSSTDNAIYGGVGFGYDFNENVGLTLSFDRYGFKAEGPIDHGHTAHANVAGITAEYRFW